MSTKKSVFFIAEMCCPTEQHIIRNRLSSFAGVEELDFNMLSREVTISHSLEDDVGIDAALASLNLGARRKIAAARGDSDRSPRHLAPLVRPRDALRLGFAGGAALAAEILAHFTGQESGLPVVALALVAIAASGREAFAKALSSLRTLTLNINFLMALAVLGPACIGQWPEAAMVMVLFGVAEKMEAYSLDRARHAVQSLLQMAPDTATVRSGDGILQEWRSVPASQVEVEQIVLVKPGERIPLDGEVTAGVSSVNQAPITGESMPVAKNPGDAVFAGSVNERGSFQFSVTADSGHTTLARIIRAVEEAQAKRAPAQRFIDEFARYYTPAVVMVALLVAVLPPLVQGADFAPWLYRALVLLVIACPCALVISTPVTVVSALAAAARHGVLVKGGAYLEAGRKLRCLALDKTGTLTHGKPVVTDLIPLSGMKPDKILQLAASLEVLSEHPVAAAIVASWTEQAPRGQKLLPVTAFESFPGRGVRGTIAQTGYRLGNRQVADLEEGGDPALGDPGLGEALVRLESLGKTTVVLFAPPKALAVIGVADTLRPHSAEAVCDLRKLGIDCLVLSGDNAAAVRAVAHGVGISEAHARLLPEEKLACIDGMKSSCGTVGMVGDGVNDAPALATAHIGFAMGVTGSGTAIETADVALMRDDLRLVAFFVRLSRQTGRVVKQNIAFALTLKVIFLALALTGHATLWMAVFADMGGSLIVVFNGLRMLSFERSD